MSMARRVALVAVGLLIGVMGGGAVMGVALGGCAASPARSLRLSREGVTEVRAQALPACREAWAEVPPALRSYDFTRDAQVTEQGNMGYQSFATRLPRQSCAKEWTVLIYMEADNQDLPPLAYWQLHEMEAAFARPGQSGASTLEADVVVQLDLDRPSGIRRLHVFGAAAPSGPRPRPAAFENATPRDIRSPIVELLPEDTEDVAAPEKGLAQFLQWGVTSYPARHYWVVIWGHGTGWRPRVTASGQPVPPNQNITNGGIGLDYHPGTVLDVMRLRDALAAVSREDLGGRPFDVLATDACLMQSVEVLAELGGVARYAIGSEQIENYLGLPYRLLLPRINGTGGTGPPPPQADCAESDSACRFASLVPGEMARSLRPGGLYAEIAPDAREPLTESVLDLTETGRLLVPALRQLSAALTLWIAEVPLRKITLQDVLLPPQGPGSLGALRRTPDFQGGMRDLGVLLDRLHRTVEAELGAPPGMTETPGGTGAGQKVLAAIAAVRSALGQTVLMAAFGTRYQTDEYVGMAGVSIWVPITGDDYQSRGDFFAASRLYAEPSSARQAVEQPWRAWLETLYQ
jgi:hypothetical protein